MLQANETGRDDQPDGDEELHAQQQRTQPAAAAGSAEGSLDDQRRGERRDIPRRVEAGCERHDESYNGYQPHDFQILRQRQRCGNVAGEFGALQGKGNVPGRQQSDQDEPERLEHEIEAQRRRGSAEDLERIDGTDAHRHQCEEEVDEVDESQHDNQHGNTQQGIGRDDRPLPAGRL